MAALARPIILCLIAALAGCAHEAPVYRTAPGPWRTAEADIALDYPAQAKQLPLHVVWPATGGPYPVVVFSHGGGSSKDMYDGLADHWASAGYVVILPTHRDSRSLGFTMQGASQELILQVLESRRQDLVFIVDSLGRLPQQVAALAGRIDAQRLVVAGHSMGGATALTVSGLVMEDVNTGSRFGFREPRFDALLLLTEPGNSPMAPEFPWRAVPVPVFVATGSRDYSGQWSGPPKQRLYRFPAELALPEGIPRHYLFIEGMDHYLGGLVCRTDVPGPPDEGALQAIRATSTVFLDAYMKNDAAALEFLRGADLRPLTGGRATLTVR
jgi:dienelactone hydrolase